MKKALQWVLVAGFALASVSLVAAMPSKAAHDSVFSVSVSGPSST